MAKRNQYSFSKRQREIKRKQKAEEKRARKLAKKEPLPGEEGYEEEEVLDEDQEAEVEEGPDDPTDA